MGLVDKTNSFATRETVIRAAVIGGVVAVVAYSVACIWHPEWLGFWWIVLPGAIVVGAALGALLEWQDPDLIGVGWVVLAVEKEFGIKVPEQDWQAIETVGDLEACVVKLVRGERGARWTESDEESILSRIKSSVARGVGLGAGEIEPSARFAEDMGIVTYGKAVELCRSRQGSN